jgi:iron(III) transport system substrate-binding protein
MKKIRALSVVIAVGFLFSIAALLQVAAAAPAPAWWKGSQADYDLLVKAAEKEGMLFWSDPIPDADSVIKAFNKLYPAIKIEHSRASTLEDREGILRELRAKATQLDVMEVSNNLIPIFHELNLLKRCNWKNFKLEPIQVDKDSEMLKVGGNLHVIAYNTDLVSPKDVPKTWDDLLDPKWKGRKIALDTRPKGFTELYTVWGEKKMLDYLQKLSKQQIAYKRGGTAMVEMLGAGEFAIAASVTTKAVIRSINKGAPVAFVVPPIVGSSYGCEAVLATAPHPNAATLFLGWLASGGQKEYDEATSGEGLPLPGFNTIQSKLVTKSNQLVFLQDEWLPKRAQIENFVIHALGITK